MFPLFSYLLALNAAMAAAAALKAFSLWRRILLPEAARSVAPFIVVFSSLAVYFALWALPELIGAGPYVIAYGQTFSGLMFFCTLAAASYTILGFARHTYIATTLFIGSGLWLTYLRVLDITPAFMWSRYGITYAEPAIRPIFKLLIAAAASALAIQMVRRSKQLRAEDREPFSRQQFAHFTLGAAALFGGMLSYYVLGALRMLTLPQALSIGVFLSLAGLVLFYRAFALEPYLPRQLDRIDRQRQ